MDNRLICLACPHVGLPCAGGCLCKADPEGRDTLQLAMSAGCVLGKHTNAGIPAGTPIPRNGVGTELMKLLSSLGIKPANCECYTLSMLMDIKGPAWCESKRPWILDRLEAAGERLELPFTRFAADRLLNQAIANAKANLPGGASSGR